MCSTEAFIKARPESEDYIEARFVGGRNGPNYGFLLDHPQFQEIIDIDEDGVHAKARVRTLMQAGLHDLATTKDPSSRDHVPVGRRNIRELLR